MIALGFQLKVYDKRDMLFTLDPPYLRRGDNDKGTWTFRQVQR
ncbi:MAG TPA: hypothetical protein VGN80_09695 [Devosiaceae bacterium]|jgi:hypothetical protein|nr:hypothetical protein [Devosiaceae bacterium]